MPWQYVDPLSGKDLPTVLGHFKRIFARLSQLVKCYEVVPTLVYGTIVIPSGALEQIQLIAVTNGVAFQVANPLLPREGVEITLDFWNNTAGAMGAVTFGAEFQLAGAFVAPAAGKHRLYSFYRTGRAEATAQKWREKTRSPADI